jgi:hypothetical protein
MAPTHVLFYVSAKNCPNCTVFLRYWDAVQEALRRSPIGERLEIESIVFESTKISNLDTTRYPVDLARFIGWFPCFILVPREAYLEVKAKKRSALPAVVFNGRLPTGAGARVEEVKGEGRLPLNMSTLIAWVEREASGTEAPVLATQEPSVDVCTRLRIQSRFAQRPRY